jgi:DNA invertase Pin-like site-specific DNA recombinase
MKKVAYYLRNSTDKGQQDYTFQREALTIELEKRNDLELVNEFAEKISGKYDAISDRPELQKMITSIECGEIEIIFCYDVKRLSRNAFVLKSICEICKKNNVNIFFLAENLNLLNFDLSANAMTSMILSLLGELAEQDRHQFIEKGIDGKVSASRANQYVGGTLPTGYDYLNHGSRFKNKTIIIDPIQRKIVEYIFDSIGNKHLTLNATAINLNNLKNIDSDYNTVMKSKNYGSKNDKWLFNSWNGSQIKSIINCTWYSLGYRYFKGEKIMLNDNLKFIDLDLYNRANEQLKNNTFIKSKTKHEYIIKDLIYCSCGHKMYTQNSMTRFNYKCKLDIQNDKDKSFKCDVSKSVGVEQIENTIFLLIKNKLPEFKLSVQKKESKTDKINLQINENNNIIDNIKNINISNLNEQRKRIINVYTKFGDVDFEIKINAIDKDLNNQQLKISELQSENKQLLISLTNLDLTSEIEQNIKMIENDKNLIKYYITKLVKKITVCGGLKGQLLNVIKIEWTELVDNTDTYLFYYSKLNINENYFFINEISGVIDPETTIMMLSRDYPIMNIIAAGQAALKIVTPFV